MYLNPTIFATLFLPIAMSLTLHSVREDTNATLATTTTDSFTIFVTNYCPTEKHIGLYQITGFPTMALTSYSPSITIPPQHTAPILAPFHALGMHLSAHAEWPLDRQWEPQALFEFGYAELDGIEGTAYDVSVMEGSDKEMGISVEPRDKRCQSKVCVPGRCKAGDGWTSVEEAHEGSPADTVCYQGNTDFEVVFCP